MLFALVLVFTLLFPSLSYNATPEEELKKVQQHIIEQKKKISEAQARESSILNEIESTSRNLSKIEGELRKLRQRLRQTESEIKTVNTEIANTQSSMEKQKDWIKRKMRSMHKIGYSGDITMLLLGSDDISQTIRSWRYLEDIARHENRILNTYRVNLKGLDEKNRQLEGLKADLSRNSQKIRTKENELAVEKKSKERLLSSVRTEKSSHEKMLSELNAASKKLLEIIRESSKTDTYSGTGFTSFKGRLPWPVDGRIAIPYGSHKDPQFDTRVFRNGIHIESEENADVRSVQEGKVIFAEWFKGFGQLVIVNHGSGYHTLYGNLSEIFSQVGDIIKNNQIIGKVGTSGILNAPGLYFEIRYKGKPLDPAQWLRKRTR